MALDGKNSSEMKNSKFVFKRKIRQRKYTSRSGRMDGRGSLISCHNKKVVKDLSQEMIRPILTEEVKEVDKRDQRMTKKLPFQVHTVMNQKDVNGVLSGFLCCWRDIKKSNLNVISKCIVSRTRLIDQAQMGLFLSYYCFEVVKQVVGINYRRFLDLCCKLCQEYLQEKLVPRDFYLGKNSKWATKEIYELISLPDRKKNKEDESFARFNLHNTEVSDHLKFDVRHPVSTFLWFDKQFPDFNNNIHKNLIGIDRGNYVNSTSNDSNVIKGWDLNDTRNRIGLCERNNSTSICKKSEIRVMNNRLHSSSSKGWGSNSSKGWGSNSMLSRSKNTGWGINASNKTWANPAPIQRTYRSWGNINSGKSNSIAVKGWDKSQYISDGNMKVNEVPWAAVLPCDASINDSTSNVIEVQA